MSFGDELRVRPLGVGWEQTERALSDVQADLSRTVDAAPRVILLWQDLPDCGERWAYVGESTTSYFTADGGVELSRDYADAITSIAAALQDAINDGLLGDPTYWPRCPEDDCGLDPWVDQSGRCVWRCRHDGKVIAEIGHLGATN